MKFLYLYVYLLLPLEESNSLFVQLLCFYQVVRGVIPGAGPQPEYHPNPYLQHIYSRHGSRDGNQSQILNMNDIEAQLQEVISQNIQNTNGTANGPANGSYTSSVLCIFGYLGPI